ncbi:MAG TPA: hypothetical protein VFO39_07845 [Candidatus Sulfotelmatobacter sp.]|nr:hypothetical protein [Candidatus Sulfotelmatobacter sp.]
MALFEHHVEMEVVSGPGLLRAVLRLRPSGALLGIEIVTIVFVDFLLLRNWHTQSLLERGLRLFIVLSGLVAMVKLLSGSEEIIEIDSSTLKITKEILGWNRTTEYPIDRCSDFQARAEEGHVGGLQCRVGRWKTIKFADYLSEEQAEEVIAALQDALPDIAEKLLPSMDITKHWTMLRLSD